MNQARKLIAVVALCCASTVFPTRFAFTQARPKDAVLIAHRNAIEKDLESVAIIERKFMVPMRDGKRMQADIYRPKDESKRYPIIFVRTPYNFNYWDIALGAPLTDADDALDWLGSRPWSTGKVGLIGCSSTAEWQLAVAARGDKALATSIPESFGAGVGRVAPYYEQGNWFRGGAVQMLFATWLYDYGFQNDPRPIFPKDATQQELIAASKSLDLDPHPPAVDWSKALWHLPEKDLLAAVGGGPGIYASATKGTTGGNMIARTPNDPAWYKGGLWNDSMAINIPGLDDVLV